MGFDVIGDDAGWWLDERVGLDVEEVLEGFAVGARVIGSKYYQQRKQSHFLLFQDHLKNQ